MDSKSTPHVCRTWDMIKKGFKSRVPCLCMLGPAYPVGHTSSKHLLHTFKKCAAHGRSPSNDYFLASCKVSLYDRCMDLLVVEKSSQLIFISCFPLNFLRPPHPRFQCWYFEARKLFFLPGGTFDRKKVRNQNPCCALPTLKSGGAGVSLVAEAYVSIVSMV